MSERYIPVPHRVLALIRDDDLLLATLVRLYRDAHLARWGWLRVTTRELRKGGVSSRALTAGLRQLVDAGLAEVEVVASGGRGEGTRIRLFDPTTVAEDERSMGGHFSGAWNEAPLRASNPSNSRERSMERSTTGQVSGASTTDLNRPDLNEPVVDDRSHQPDLLLPPDIREVGPSEGPVRGEDSFHRVAGFWSTDVARAVGRPLRAPSRSSAVGQKLLTKLKNLGEDVVLDAMRLYAHGGDRGEFLRERKTTLETVVRHAEEYAELWREQATTHTGRGPLLTRDVFPAGPPEPDDPSPRAWVPEHRWKPTLIPGIDDIDDMDLAES